MSAKYVLHHGMSECLEQQYVSGRRGGDGVPSLSGHVVGSSAWGSAVKMDVHCFVQREDLDIGPTLPSAGNKVNRALYRWELHWQRAKCDSSILHALISLCVCNESAEIWWYHIWIKKKKIRTAIMCCFNAAFVTLGYRSVSRKRFGEDKHLSACLKIQIHGTQLFIQRFSWCESGR